MQKLNYCCFKNSRKIGNEPVLRLIYFTIIQPTVKYEIIGSFGSLAHFGTSVKIPNIMYTVYI